jgi:CheY-like chemotaxis protein
MRATRSMLRPVLVVEDHADSREMLCAFLAVSAFPCVSVTSATDALLALRTQRPWLILLDLMMPEMDGVAFREQQRQLDATLAWWR